MKTLRRLVDDLSKTVIIVLPDLNFSASYADGFVGMKVGRLNVYGTTEEVIQTDVLKSVVWYGNPNL